jgi:hypothetical protein
VEQAGNQEADGRSTIAQPSRSGAAVSSWRGTGTHAAQGARPVSPSHERSKNVFPLPADADIRVTRAAPASRAERARRETIPRQFTRTT